MITLEAEEFREFSYSSLGTFLEEAQKRLSKNDTHINCRFFSGHAKDSKNSAFRITTLQN